MNFRESLPSLADEKSRVPEEVKEVQSPRAGERGPGHSRRTEQTFFLHCFVLSIEHCILLQEMFLLTKNLLTNLVILRCICGSGFGETFVLSVLILLV